MRRLMRILGLEAIYSQAPASRPGDGHRIYPTCCGGVKVERRDQVWSADITYIPMAAGFMYLAAVIDWFSRYVVAWRLSNTLDGSFCLEMLEEVFEGGRPEVFNTDQVCVFAGGGIHRMPGGAGVVSSGRPGACAGQRVRGAG